MKSLFATKKRQHFLSFALMAALSMIEQNAFAFTAPAAGTAFYDIYSMVNTSMSGGLGNAVALGGVALGTWQAVAGDWKKGLTAGMGVAGLAKSTSIVTGLGMIVLN